MAVTSALGTYTGDNSLIPTFPSRTGAYGEAYVAPVTNKEFFSADEGSYLTFLSPTSQTGITGQINTSLTLTTPTILIFNGTTKRLYPQFLALTITTASTTGTTGGFTLTPYIDAMTSSTYTSGGTPLTISNSTPSAAAVSTSGLTAYAGAITSLTNTSAAISLGDYCFRYTSPDIIGDQCEIVFGAGNSNGGARTKPATLCDISRTGSPLCIPPGYGLKIFQWRAAQDGAPVFQVRMGAILR